MNTKKYIFLQETTKWNDDTRNHTYIFESNKSTKTVGYIPCGENTIYFFNKPMVFDKRKRTFKEINITQNDYSIVS